MQYQIVGLVVLTIGVLGCEFERPQNQPGNSLTVQVVGEGIGTVSGGGITCATGDAGTCHLDVPEGTSITLSRQAGAATEGSRVTLGAWGGDCASAGTAAQCTLVVDGELVVSASFELEHRLDLIIGAGSTGQGQLTAAPGSFACSSGACSEFFPSGSSVTVDAVPTSALDRVTAISGACSAFPCALRFDGPRTVAASFTRDVCAASTAVCTIGRLTACDDAGNYVVHEVPNGGTDGAPVTLVMHDYACPLGCHASGSRCNDIAPTNGLAAVLDTVGASASGVDLVLPRSASAPPGLMVIDTDNFDASTNEVPINDADGSTFRAPARVIVQSDAPEILAIATRSFTLRPGRALEVRGRRALAVVSHFDVFIGGTIDLSGVASLGPRHAPGSYNAGACRGVNTGGSSNFGGNANATRGGRSSDGSAGGEPYSLDGLQPLRGGCGGEEAPPNSGGGAFQIVSRTRVALPATGKIDVSGGGGSAIIDLFPTGGGSGGSIVVEAPTISITSAAIIAGRGGSGAATNVSTGIFIAGIEGTTTGGAGAAAVTCSGCGRSGAGGTEATAAGDADQTGNIIAAGGGGGVGRCVLRNATGVLSPPAGSLLIARTIEAVATR